MPDFQAMRQLDLAVDAERLLTAVVFAGLGGFWTLLLVLAQGKGHRHGPRRRSSTPSISCPRASSMLIALNHRHLNAQLAPEVRTSRASLAAIVLVTLVYLALACTVLWLRAPAWWAALVR
jgi:hypothetical protein